MHTFIANSTAAKPLGIPNGRKCLSVAGGQYANRLAVLYAVSASQIALVWADSPYADFAEPANVVTDSADSPFDAWIDSSGNIYLAYTVSGSKNLGFVKLTFSDGTWSAGSPVTVYDADDCFYPSIRKLSSGVLWIAYTRVSGGSHYISAKASVDDGASWGTVSDPGDTLTAGAAAAFTTMVEAGVYQYVFYCEGGGKIACRKKLVTGIIWNSEEELAIGAGFNEHFAVAVNDDGCIALTYAGTAGLKFREYSGSSWSAEYSIDDHTCSHPVATFQGGVPYLVYHRVYGTGMDLVCYSKKADTVFTGPIPLDDRKSYLQKLIVYDASAGTCQDKTGPASSTDTADVFHSTSGGLMAAAGDTVYFGMNNPFHFLNALLSTTGSGGEVVWKYWDGQVWKAFTPLSGVWHFTTAAQRVLLWKDYNAIPGDWQKTTVSDNLMYWLAVSVISPFTQAPVGTQITTIAALNALTGQA